MLFSAQIMEGQIRRGILDLYWRTYAFSKGSTISGQFCSTGNYFLKTVFTKLVKKRRRTFTSFFFLIRKDSTQQVFRLWITSRWFQLLSRKNFFLGKQWQLNSSFMWLFTHGKITWLTLVFIMKLNMVYHNRVRFSQLDQWTFVCMFSKYWSIIRKK